jgi:ABC-2 type transport system permease protein
MSEALVRANGDGVERRKPTAWEGLLKAWAISAKDMKIYYFQPAILIFGLVFPIAIFFAFLIGRDVQAVNLFPGLIALTLFFSTTTVAPFSVPWEKMNRTFERLLFAPVSMFDAVLGKVMSALLFGLVISLVPLAIGLIFFGSHITNYGVLILALVLGNLCMATMGMLVSTVNADTPPKVMMVLNVVRLPLMFVSGIFIALPTLPAYGRVLAWFSPVSYAADLLYKGMGFKAYFGVVVSTLMLLAFTAAMFAWSVHRMSSWNK